MLQDGCKLMVLSLAKHIKGADSLEDIKKVLVYYLERLEREEEDKQISWVFDCKGAGLKNMSMDLVQFIIFTMESCYPDILNFIYIFEMPWLLNSAFAVNLTVSTFLPRLIKILSLQGCQEDVARCRRGQAEGCDQVHL